MDAAGERVDADERRGDVGRLGVVDVEHAVDRRDLLEPVLRGRGSERRPARTASASTPRASATAAAAIAFCTLWAPRRPSSETASSGCSSHHSWPARSASSAPGPAPKQTRRAQPPRSSTPRPSGATATASLGWRAKTSQLGGAVGVEGAVAVQVVLGEVEQHGGLGRERLACPRAGTSDASATIVVAGRERARAATVSAVPTLPATFTGSPASRCRWPISSTVVVLPLEPVTAMNSCSPSSRQPVSYSPSTGIPRSRAAATTGASFGTPGLLITLPAPREQLDAVGAARARSTPAARRRSAASSRHRARVDAGHLRAALAQRQRRGHARAGEADDEVRAGRERRARRSRGPFKRAASAATRRRAAASGRRGDVDPLARYGRAAARLPASAAASGADAARADARPASTAGPGLRRRGRVAVGVVDEPQLLGRADPGERGEAPVGPGPHAGHGPPGPAGLAADRGERRAADRRGRARRSAARGCGRARRTGRCAAAPQRRARAGAAAARARRRAGALARAAAVRHVAAARERVRRERSRRPATAAGAGAAERRRRRRRDGRRRAGVGGRARRRVQRAAGWRPRTVPASTRAGVAGGVGDDEPQPARAVGHEPRVDVERPAQRLRARRQPVVAAAARRARACRPRRRRA